MSATPPTIRAGVIEANGLTKRLGGRVVVNDVSFRCEPGTVTGFLGPNGAGKTTTMRMVCSLSTPDAGEAVVLGGPYHELPNPGRRVGVLLDASAQHGGRRGREALAVSALTMGVDRRRIAELLELVGLDKSAARKRVRQYSLGMRQRLGLAHALLGEPEVLILDEPANGLDPEGMRWLRGLLRDFADRGGTVFLSSHLLQEVDAVADRLVIIGNGRIVAQGTRDELLAGTGTIVRARDDRALGAALDAAGLKATPAGEGGFLVDADPEDVGRAALTGRVALIHLGPSESAGLEQLFFELTDNAPPPPDGRVEVASMSAVDIPLAAPKVYKRPSLARLTLVELRKMVDTRSGFWLLLGAVILTGGIVAVFSVFAKPGEIRLSDELQVALQPASILLPILGVLLVTSEWSQRTAMITFSLVPRRSRIFAAKLAAGVVLALAVMAICLPAAAAGTALATSDTTDTWSLSATLLGQMTLSVVIGMFTGLGYGSMLLSSAPAIVLYFVLPFVWVGLAAIPQLHGVAHWLDPTRTLGRLTDNAMSATEWEQAGATIALWLGVPLAVGFWRIMRGEIR